MESNQGWTVKPECQCTVDEEKVRGKYGLFLQPSGVSTRKPNPFDFPGHVVIFWDVSLGRVRRLRKRGNGPQGEGTPWKGKLFLKLRGFKPDFNANEGLTLIEILKRDTYPGQICNDGVHLDTYIQLCELLQRGELTSLYQSVFSEGKIPGFKNYVESCEQQVQKGGRIVVFNNRIFGLLSLEMGSEVKSRLEEVCLGELPSEERRRTSITYHMKIENLGIGEHNCVTWACEVMGKAGGIEIQLHDKDPGRLSRFEKKLRESFSTKYVSAARYDESVSEEQILY